MYAKSAESLVQGIAARLPQSGKLDSIGAAADEEKVLTLEAAAVRGFASLQTKLVWVKAQESFMAAGEPIPVGGFVQLPEADANLVIRHKQAVAATEEEAAKAQKASKE